jgi:hypothetical protein
MNGNRRHDDTTTEGETVQLTARLYPVVHHHLAAESERSGKSLNRLLNEAVLASLTPPAPPGAASKIVRIRRRLSPRPLQVQAAMAFLLSYLGKAKEARKLWPAGWGDFPGQGTTDDLVYGAALMAVEHDMPQRAAAPSGAR